VQPPTTRKRLIDAACSILATESFSNLSIDKITERAGVARRTFFLHFSSKDELLAAVLQEIRPLRLAKLDEWSAVHKPQLTLEQRICGYFDSMIAESSDRNWRGSLFIRLSAEFAELRGHPIHGIVAETYREMAAWFEAEFRRHHMSSAKLRSEELIILLNGLLVRQLVEPSPLHGEAVRRMLPDILAARDNPPTPADD
jgi:AcrR family transcriptional regulator